MIGIFKQSSPLQILALLLTIAVLWGRAFVWPVAPVASDQFGPLYEPLYGWLAHLPRVASAVALLLTLGEGIWLNVILYNKKVTTSSTLFPLFFYIVAMSAMPDRLTLTPTLLVNLAVIAALGELLSGGWTSLSFGHNFNASFCVGLAALVYLPAIAYVVPMLIVFVIYKLYRWRDVVVGVLGLVAPMILVGTYAFMTDRWDYYLYLIGHDLADLQPRVSTAGMVAMATNAMWLLLTAVMLVHHLSTVGEGVVVRRINSGVLTLPMLAGVLMLFYSTLFPTDMQLFAPTFAFLATMFFLADWKRHWVAPTALWVLLLATLANVWIGI